MQLTQSFSWIQGSTEGEFLAEAEGRSRRSKNFGLRPKAEAEGIKIGIFSIFQKSCGVSICSEMHDILCLRAFEYLSF